MLCVSDRKISRSGEDVHDHLLASKQWVADELAGAESDFGHGCDVNVEMKVKSS